MDQIYMRKLLKTLKRYKNRPEQIEVEALFLDKKKIQHKAPSSLSIYKCKMIPKQIPLASLLLLLLLLFLFPHLFPRPFFPWSQTS